MCRERGWLHGGEAAEADRCVLPEPPLHVAASGLEHTEHALGGQRDDRADRVRGQSRGQQAQRPARVVRRVCVGLQA